jgi:hypothetical protein
MAEAGRQLSDSELRRYSRQILLREVGGRGQRSILDAELVLICPPGSGPLAVRYLLRAGVGRLLLFPSSEAVAATLRVLLESEQAMDRATIEPLAALPDWLAELQAVAPSYLLGGWTDRPGDGLYWAAGYPQSSCVGLGESALHAQLATASAVTPSGPQALVIGAALATVMLQGRLGLQPSDPVHIPG